MQNAKYFISHGVKSQQLPYLQGEEGHCMCGVLYLQETNSIVGVGFSIIICNHIDPNPKGMEVDC